MFHMLDLLSDIEPDLRCVGDELAAAMMHEEVAETPWRVMFMDMAAPAYAAAVCSDRYWFSGDELLCVAIQPNLLHGQQSLDHGMSACYSKPVSDVWVQGKAYR